MAALSRSYASKNKSKDTKNQNAQKKVPNGKPCSKCGHDVHVSDACPAASVKYARKQDIMLGVAIVTSSKVKKLVKFRHFLKKKMMMIIFLRWVVGSKKNQWKVNIQVQLENKHAKDINFTIDSGADVTCMPSHWYNPD